MIEKGFEIDVNVTSFAIKHHLTPATYKKYIPNLEEQSETVKSKFSPQTCDYFMEQLQKCIHTPTKLLAAELL